METTITLYEDNGGQLYLDDGSKIYDHMHYADPGSMIRDCRALADGDTWDTDVENPDELRDTLNAWVTEGNGACRIPAVYVRDALGERLIVHTCSHGSYFVAGAAGLIYLGIDAECPEDVPEKDDECPVYVVSDWDHRALNRADGANPYKLVSQSKAVSD